MHSHIVAIRRQGVVEGHQLRINGGGAGQSKFFAAVKYGGPDKARQAAEREAKSMGLPKAGKRGGSAAGRLPSASATGAAGIRFMWVEGVYAPLLRVVATWTDKRGKNRQTSYSVDKNGLQGALDRAIAARISCGAPVPERAPLLRRLRKEYATRGATEF